MQTRRQFDCILKNDTGCTLCVGKPNVSNATDLLDHIHWTLQEDCLDRFRNMSLECQPDYQNELGVATTVALYEIALRPQQTQ